MNRPAGNVLPDAAAARCEDPGSLGVTENPVRSPFHSETTGAKINIQSGCEASHKENTQKESEVFIVAPFTCFLRSENTFYRSF